MAVPGWQARGDLQFDTEWSSYADDNSVNKLLARAVVRVTLSDDRQGLGVAKLSEAITRIRLLA